MDNCYDFRLSCNRVGLQLCNSTLFSEREIHPYHEILFCEGAVAKLRTENGQIKIRGNQLFIIPKGKYHMFDLSGGGQLKRLKISIPDELVSDTPIRLFSGDIRILHPTEQGVAFILDRLCELLRGKESAEQLHHAYSAVMLLLSELNLLTEAGEVSGYQGASDAVLEVAIYISENLSGDLRVEELSRAVNFSPSFLSHKFKEEMGISLHRYIVEKRLAYAKERIDRGEPPSKIYRECGYGDYSSFYKAYLRRFAAPPSEREHSWR